VEHEHEYETISHPSISSEAGTLGITAAELRKCRTCQKIIIFIMTSNRWIPLFDERELGEQDILLA
jgi:hypothetical protein